MKSAAVLFFALCFAAPVYAQSAAVDPPPPAQIIEKTLAQLTAASLPAIQKRAGEGDAEAQFKLGLAYLNGKGVEKNGFLASMWLNQADEQGHPLAYPFVLALIYSLGDEARAMNWGRKSIAQGIPLAQTLTPVPTSVAQTAARELRQQAEKGDAIAQFILGADYELGFKVARNLAQAAEWYRKAAEQGLDRAQYALGNLYCKGRGVAQDDVEAARWYRQAAEQGLARAQYALGNFYGKGRGVTQDDVQAARWYRQAAEQGNADAQYALGERYERGLGVAQDDVEAHAWYSKAAANTKGGGIGGFLAKNKLRSLKNRTAEEAPQ
jgi:TPR repeat protein